MAPRPDVLRRIDVRASTRRLENRARCARAACCDEAVRDDRLPAEHEAPRFARSTRDFAPEFCSHMLHRAVAEAPIPWAAYTAAAQDALASVCTALTERGESQGAALFGVAVLRNGAVSVQLSRRSAGAFAGRDARASDQCRRLQRTRQDRISAQRNLHLPAILRWLPRVRPGACAGRGVCRDRTQRRPAGTRRSCSRAWSRWRSITNTTTCICAISRRVTPAAAWTTTAASSTRSSCCRAGSTRGWSNSAIPGAADARHIAHGLDHRRAERRPVVGLHVLRSRRSARATARTTFCGRSSSAASSGCPTCIWATGSPRARRWRTRPRSARWKSCAAAAGSG